MTDYKPLIVNDVHRSITAVNDVVTALHRDAPLTSDLMEINYSKTTIDSFHNSSKAVVDVTVPLLGRYGVMTDFRLPEHSGRVGQGIQVAFGDRRPALAQP